MNKTNPTPQLMNELKRVSWFDQLQRHTQQWSIWRAAFKMAVNHELAEHCYPLSWDQGKLVLETQSAEWAMHVRFQQQELKKSLALHPVFSGIRSIYCQIKPSATNQASNHRLPSPPQSISAESARAILEIANGIQDERLSEALRRLAGFS